VSLFASFITVIASGGQGENAQIPVELYRAVAGLLSVSDPTLLIGMLIGGAVPFLFSSMTIRAVSRAAYLIVNECRIQFKVPGVMEGKVTPDYAKVVGICTTAAQKELVGPGILAVMTPVLVGFSFGPLALAGFLAGTILSGQLLAVFMANAGGAWDNTKKCVEDEPRNPEKNLGKGSERHKAAVTGDTVGDPLKDTAGPAINPLIKVMNMVALLIIPLIIPFHAATIDTLKRATQELYLMNKVPREFYEGIIYLSVKPVNATMLLVIAVSLLSIVWAVWQSNRESAEMKAVRQAMEKASA
jgi:K(+)-stimulated pyrophosphate-energized sodium pump